MKYLFLVRVTEGADPAPEDADATPWWTEANERGMWLGGDRLRPPADATLVRQREGRTLVSDGPFAEFKEQIAGYDLIEAPDMESALDLASRHPVTRFGAIEVREIWPFES